MLFEFDFCFTLRHSDPPIHIQGEKAISLSYGHTQLNPPHPVRSAKLNSRWQSQYYGGGPHGNTLCCSFLFFFCQSFIFCTHTHLICTHSHTWWSPFCLSFVPFALTHTWYAPIHACRLFFLPSLTLDMHPFIHMVVSFSLVVCSYSPHLICIHSRLSFVLFVFTHTWYAPIHTCRLFLFAFTHTWYTPIHTHGGRIVH